MPIPGPDGQDLYLPREAYEITGSHLFGRTWGSPYAPGAPLLHPSAAVRSIDSGRLSDAEVERIGDPTDGEYKFRQSRVHRTEKVLNVVFEILSWGKADGWESVDGQWHRIEYHRWEQDGVARQMFLDELETVINGNRRSPRNLGVEAAQFSHWLGEHPAMPVDPTVALGERRKPGRKPLDWDALIQELLRRERESELRSPERGWRETISRALSEWYVENIEPERREPPSVKTIKKRLKHHLDRIQGEFDRIQNEQG